MIIKVDIDHNIAEKNNAYMRWLDMAATTVTADATKQL